MFFKYDNINIGLDECFKKSKEWLDSHPGVKEKLTAYFAGFEELQFAVPLEAQGDLTKWNPDDGPFPFIPPWLHIFYECDQELDSIVTSCLCGLYKDSLRAIRSLLELNLLGLYFFAKQDYKHFKNWLDGNSETPKRSHLVAYLIQNNGNIKKLDKLMWQKQVAQSYKELSAFIHTSGKKGSFSALRLSNTTVFSDATFAYILEHLLTVMKLVAMGRIAMFPISLQSVDVVRKFGFNGPIMGWLDEYQVNRIEKLFTDADLDVLREISFNDPDANSRIQAVSQANDLTDQELLEDLEKYVERLTSEEDRSNFLNSIKDSSLGRIAALVMARNKAFMRCTIPVLNEHFLGLIEEQPVDGGRATL